MRSYAEQQNDFMLAMGSPLIERDGAEKCCKLAESLIYEEVINETLPALRRFQNHQSLENLTELADGIIDSVYVLCHAANSLGIPFDLVWDEVHRSNMAKIGPDGRVRKREDGKILKPEGWTPPNIWAVLHDYQTRLAMGNKYMVTGLDTRGGLDTKAKD